MARKGKQRATGFPRGQLELMPSTTGADEREPEPAGGLQCATRACRHRAR